MMVGNNLKDTQLQQIVDKTILLYDKVGAPHVTKYSTTSQTLLSLSLSLPVRSQLSHVSPQQRLKVKQILDPGRW